MHAVLQQRAAIRRIAAVHGRYVGGLQRIGQQADVDPGVCLAGQEHQPRLRRHEVGRDQNQLVLYAFELGQQLRGQQQMRVGFPSGQNLAGGVPHDFAGRPDHLASPDAQLGVRLVAHKPVIQRWVCLSRFDQLGIQALACLAEILASETAIELADRPTQRAVPVLIKAVPQLPSHGAGTEQVDVGEIQVGLGIEILIAHIAPANDAHGVIGEPQLVVHASMLLRQVEQPPHCPGSAGHAP